MEGHALAQFVLTWMPCFLLKVLFDVSPGSLTWGPGQSHTVSTLPAQVGKCFNKGYSLASTEVVF
jgi:hypothetical protein